MSVLHVVKVSGKSKAELIKGLKAAIAELGETSITTGRGVQIASSPEQTVKDLVDAGHEDDGEEMEEVESKYAGAAPSAHLIDNEKDAEGLPWDARIHSSNKGKTTKGVWKQRKFVDAATIAAVKAELFARGAQASAPVQQNVQAPVYQAPAQTAPAVHVMPASQPVAAAPALPPQQVQTGHTVQTFTQNFAYVINVLLTEQKINADYVQKLCGHYGVAHIWEVNDQAKAEIFKLFVDYKVITAIG